MPPIRLAVLGSTRGTSMQPIIDAIGIGKLNASIGVVVSNKKNAPILERAKNNGIPSVAISTKKVNGSGQKTREEFDDEVNRVLYAHHIDLVLLIGYMRILSPAFVEKWPKKIMNVHPSLLPKFAGGMDLDVHTAVLAAGETETGCTIHWVDTGVDTGEIIVQKKCPVLPMDTPASLKERVQTLEGQAFIEAISMMI